MADEAILVEDPTIIRDYTVAAGVAIPQFTWCALEDPRTAVISSGANIFAGISMTEKDATSDAVNLGLAQDGIFVGTASNEDIAVGKLVVLSGANVLREAVAGDLLIGAVCGKALEAIAKTTTGEVDIGVRG